MVNIEGVKKYRSYKVKIVPATSTKPKRIRIIDELIGISKLVECDYISEDYVKKVILILFKKGIVIKGIVHKGDEAYLLSDDFSKSL